MAKFSVLFGSISIIALLAVAGLAQSITGTITGMVVDTNGGAIPSAAVTITSDQTGAKRTAVSNEEGRFAMAALQPGSYTIRVEREGFQRLLRGNIVLSANENLALGDLTLSPGSVKEEVTVTSEGAIVDSESSDLTARLTADQLSLISTKGRDVTSLLRLIPGTSNIPDIEAVGNGFGTTLPTFFRSANAINGGNR